MKKMRMCFLGEKTFADGFAEYILDMKAISFSFPLHEPFKARGASSIQQLTVNRRELMGFVKSL